MPLSTGQNYPATLFTPGDIRAYPATNIDRVEFPGTVMLRQSGSNEVVISGTNAQITALETSITALDSDSGHRGLPVHFLIGTTRYTFWTNGVTFNTGKTEAVIDLTAPIDLPSASSSTTVTGGYFITSPNRIDADGVSQSALPTDERPVAEGAAMTESISVRVTDEVVQREGTVYTVEFSAQNRVTNNSRIQIAEPVLEYGIVYADDVSKQAGSTLWRAQIADDEYLAATAPQSPAAQAPVSTITSFNGFTKVTLVTNDLEFERPDGTTATITLPSATASLIAGISIENNDLVITTQGGTVTRLTIPTSESDDDFTDVSIAGTIITFTTRGGDTSNTVTLPIRTNAEIDTRADARVRAAGNAATTSQRGNIELATNAEAQGGADTERAVTPSGLRSSIVTDGNIRDAIDARADARITAGVQSWARDTTTAIPLNKLGNAPSGGLTEVQVDSRIQAVPNQATTTRRGTVIRSRDQDAIAGTNTSTYLTPANLRAAITTDGNIQDAIDARITAATPTIPTALTNRAGIVELATNTETIDGASTDRAVTPRSLRSAIESSGVIRSAIISAAGGGSSGGLTQAQVDARVRNSANAASTTQRGNIAIATTSEAADGTNTSDAVTPAGLEAWGNRNIAFTQSGTTVNRSVEQVFVAAVNRAIADGDLVI